MRRCGAVSDQSPTEITQAPRAHLHSAKALTMKDGIEENDLKAIACALIGILELVINLQEQDEARTEDE